MGSTQKISITQFVNQILKGNKVFLAKAITLIESTRHEDFEKGQAILEKCLKHTGKSIRIGITGVPGVGKSTFIEALGNYILEEKGRSLAVLAVDPTSTKTKGSILGDKTRMSKLSQSDKAFIRPSPSSGELGGVASRTREAMLLSEAAGFNTVFIETVGVGQSETAVHSMVDFFLLLLLPGAGDELQGMKRGIVEMADLIAINKADGNNLQQAKLAQGEYRQALHLFPPSNEGWDTPVLVCSALTHDGISDIWTAIQDFEKQMKTMSVFENKRKEQRKHWLNEILRNLMMQSFHQHETIKTQLPRLQKAVTEGKTTAFSAANELLKAFK